MLGKARRINSKHKNLRRNRALLEETCRRRFPGAPDCVSALKEGSLYQLEPVFLYRHSSTGTERYGSGNCGSAGMGGRDAAGISRAGYMDQFFSSSSTSANWHNELTKAEDALQRHAELTAKHSKSELSLEGKAAESLSAGVGSTDFDNVDEMDDSHLGLALLHFSKAAAMITDSVVIHGGDEERTNVGNSTAVTAAASLTATHTNVAGTYLELAISTISAAGLRKIRYFYGCSSF